MLRIKLHRHFLPTLTRAFSSTVLPKDYHSILGVARNAKPEAIKEAYFQLAKKHHPDLSTGKSEKELERSKMIFQEISEAYQVLLDETKSDLDGPSDSAAHSPMNNADTSATDPIDESFYHKVFAA